MIRRVAALSLSTGLLMTGTTAAVADEPNKGEQTEQICDEPSVVHQFSSVSRSSRPTGLKSAYVTGPAIIRYNKTVSTSVGASYSSAVSAEGSIVVAKASATIGTSLSASRSWTDGFEYDVTVPSGQRRALQLFQESRYFLVTKKTLRSPCTYVTVYSGASVNAPRTVRQDEWKLVS